MTSSEYGLTYICLFASASVYYPQCFDRNNRTYVSLRNLARKKPSMTNNNTN